MDQFKYTFSSRFISIGLHLSQGLLVLRPGGDLVLRLHSAYTRYTASLVLLASLCFCSSSLFRPPSMPSWSPDAFFIGRGRRQLETGFVLQVLCASWNALVAANRKERSGDAPSNIHHSEAIIDFGGVAAEWALQQCMKAKLFTDLVANRCDPTRKPSAGPTNCIPHFFFSARDCFRQKDCTMHAWVCG